jgi:hypothetical protein
VLALMVMGGVCAAVATARAQQPVPAAPATSAIGKRIAVLEFDALGMEADKVTRLEALFRIELERLAGAASPSPREIQRALKGSALARCTGESKCLAAIGKKLSVDLVVTGNVAELGDSYVVNIKVVDAKSGAELRRIASDPLRGNADELIDAVRVAAYRLLAPERLLGGILVLADIAGAEVRLDGAPVGRTPLARPIQNLPLGHHKLEVSASGYSPFAEDVLVRFQKTTRVLVKLDAASESAAAAADAEARRRAALTQRAATGPAEKRWYQRTWFLVGAGVAAVVVGGFVGYALTRDEVIDCSTSPESCR